MKKANSSSCPNLPPPETIEGRYEMPPSFKRPDSSLQGIGVITSDSQQSVEEASLRSNIAHRLSSLSHSDLLEHAIETELKVHEWGNAASSLMTTLALSPEMTDVFYARSLRALLTSALETLDSIDELKHVECSMPSIAAEAPTIDLVHWSGLHFSEWDVQWTPTSWWVSVSADGSRWGLAFNCLAKVSEISLAGRLRCSFSRDLSAVRVRFAHKPCLDTTVDTSVGWGAVPLPVRESIVHLIQSEIENFVNSRLCNDEGMIIVLRRKPLLTVSESDIFEATLQARRAGNIKLRTTTLF